MDYPDPELVAAVDQAMVDALVDIVPILRAAAAASPLLREAPEAETIIKMIRESGLDDPDSS